MNNVLFIGVFGTTLSVILSAEVKTTQNAKSVEHSTQKAPSISIGQTSPAYDVTELQKLPVMQLLEHPKFIDGYTGCLLNKRPCTPDADEVKGIMENAMTKNCSKCSPIQKQVFEKLMIFYDEKQPEIIKEISKIYDPKGEFKSHLGSIKKAAAKSQQ